MEYYYTVKESDLYKYADKTTRDNFILMFELAEEAIKKGLKKDGFDTETVFEVVEKDISEVDNKEINKQEAVDYALDLLVKIVSSDLDNDAYKSIASSIRSEPLLDIDEHLLDDSN